MHASKNDISVTLEAGAAYSRDTQWGEMNVAFEGFPSGMDTRPLFEGLPTTAANALIGGCCSRDD